MAIAARRTDRLEALAARSSPRAGGAGDRGRVTDREQADAAVSPDGGGARPFDVVINNAGVMLLGPIVDAPVDEWEQMVQLNVLGLLYVAQRLVPHLLEAADAEPRRVSDLVNISSVAGRQVRTGSGVYNATKHAVGAFSESLRQEVTGRHVRVSLIEPGAVSTELSSHNREPIRERIEETFGDIDRLEAEDIADAIAYVVTRPRHVAVNEVLVRPTEQQQ